MAELWSAADIARALRVTPSTVHRWARERRDFPNPEGGTAAGRVWRAARVRDWYRREIARRRDARAF